MNIYLDMFVTFAKVGAFTFGGGYAMLPMLQSEVVDKKNGRMMMNCSTSLRSDNVRLASLQSIRPALSGITRKGYRERSWQRRV